MRKVWNDWRVAVRMLCALALLFVAFAHQPISVASAQEDLSAYTLPDGSLPVLCLTDTSSESDHHKSAWHGNGCEACRLASSVILPVPTAASAKKVELLQLLAVKREAALIARHAYPPAAPPQAPPFA